jgi:hypothetical protein
MFSWRYGRKPEKALKVLEQGLGDLPWDFEFFHDASNDTVVTISDDLLDGSDFTDPVGQYSR